MLRSNSKRSFNDSFNYFSQANPSNMKCPINNINNEDLKAAIEVKIKLHKDKSDKYSFYNIKESFNKLKYQNRLRKENEVDTISFINHEYEDSRILKKSSIGHRINRNSFLNEYKQNNLIKDDCDFKLKIENFNKSKKEEKKLLILSERIKCNKDDLNNYKYSNNDLQNVLVNVKSKENSFCKKEISYLRKNYQNTQRKSPYHNVSKY